MVGVKISVAPPGRYATVLLPWASVHAGWPGFIVFEHVRWRAGWPALEVFGHIVEYRGIRVTVRRAGDG